MSVDQQESIKLLKIEKLKALEAEKKRRDSLPHLYGQKFYNWSRLWFEDTTKFSLMFKGNQVGGSSVQIRKCIDWATDPVKRKELFNKDESEMLVFLYFMPSLNLFAREFHTKWVPQFMPRGEAREVGLYSWEAQYDEKKLESINFIKFKEANTLVITLSYSSDVHKAMQAMSPSAVFADEEMPAHIFGEVIARLSATKGYFNMTCTPTRGEKLWEDAYSNRKFPDAFKLQVSQYMCQFFEDGTKGVHSLEDIRRFEQTLPTQRDIDVRVHGKFSKIAGLVYQQFDREKNTKALKIDTPLYYAGVDYGSGGITGHPSAITILAVDANFKKARVHKFWRGDNERTTAGDLFQKYLEMSEGLQIVRRRYDWAAADFATIAQRNGCMFEKANKNKEQGVSIINTLFKNQMLEIPNNEENEKLMQELESFKVGDKVNRAENDGCDSLRYAITDIPFDFGDLTLEFVNDIDTPVVGEGADNDYKKRTKTRFELAGDHRRTNDFDDYLDFYNDLMGEV